MSLEAKSMRLNMGWARKLLAVYRTGGMEESYGRKVTVLDDHPFGDVRGHRG